MKTATPRWQVYQNKADKHGNNSVFIISGGNVKTADCIAKIEHGRVDRAKHIVACVNACEGINPEAVADMLKALEAAYTLLDDMGCTKNSPIRTVWGQLQKAIIKAKVAS